MLQDEVDLKRLFLALAFCTVLGLFYLFHITDLRKPRPEIIFVHGEDDDTYATGI